MSAAAARVRHRGKQLGKTCRSRGKDSGRRRLHATDIAFICAIAASLGVLLYLNGADLYAQYVAERHIEQMEALYSDKDDPARLEYLRQARMFNDQMAGKEVDGDVLDYRSQLFYREEPMISHIEIPKIHVKLPIYHGVEENALMAGAGHWERSSLPVGGETSHCVLMGHTGMRNTRMFDDLHRLTAGDRFVIWTLGDPYAYEVYAVETVLPEEVASRIELVRGSDLVTLVTCTPHGINSHRLLVHARRCEYVDDIGEVGIDAYVNDRNLPLLIAGGLAAGTLAATAVGKKARKRRAA